MNRLPIFSQGMSEQEYWLEVVDQHLQKTLEELEKLNDETTHKNNDAVGHN